MQKCMTPTEEDSFHAVFNGRRDAASWKQQLIEETPDWALLAGTDPDFGTFGNFIGSLKEAFEPYNSEGNVLE